MTREELCIEAGQLTLDAIKTMQATDDADEFGKQEKLALRGCSLVSSLGRLGAVNAPELVLSSESVVPQEQEVTQSPG